VVNVGFWSDCSGGWEAPEKSPRGRIILVRRCLLAAASSLLGLLPRVAACQFAPDQIQQARSALNSRIEALTILGGDFGLSGGSFSSISPNVLPPDRGTDTTLDVSKFGGAGDVGDPRPLGGLPIAWQPRLQGNMGYLESTNHLTDGDVSTFSNYAIQFGGGARLWLSEHFSVASTLMGMYGHTWNTYTANSLFMRSNLSLATKLGLVDWSVETWTLRPALDFQYVFRWDRTVITVSSDPTYFHTQSFGSSNPAVRLSGNSGSLENKIDLDVPLGRQLFGHELHMGGYLSRTELFGELQTGLDAQHINEVHGRLVLDYLNQLWKFQWIGIGGSYLWGTNIKGWTIDADIAFHF
jgi:hypothetical protein